MERGNRTKKGNLWYTCYEGPHQNLFSFFRRSSKTYGSRSENIRAKMSNRKLGYFMGHRTGQNSRLIKVNGKIYKLNLKEVNVDFPVTYHV